MAMYVTIKDVEVKVGDTVQLTYRISKDGDKLQTQTFEGILIGVQNRGVNKSITVRKIATGGVGVERIFPIESPVLLSVTLKNPGKVRRAKLNYLRDRIGKAATTIKQDSVRLEKMRKQEREEKIARSTKKSAIAEPVEKVEQVKQVEQVKKTEVDSTDSSEPKTE